MGKVRPATLVFGVVAVALAMAGAVSVRQMLSRQPVEEEVVETSPAQKVYVPLAATDLKAGRKITASDVANRSFSASDYAKSKYSTTLHISQSTQIIGRVLNEPLKAGSVFVPDSFFPEGTGPTVASAVPLGKLAVTVEIAGSGFVDGFATPGTLVDVLFRSSKSELEEIHETTVTVLHAIEVLAVNSRSYPFSRPVDDAQDRLPESVKVTLAVAPDEVNKLKALEGRGELSLALRSEEELGLDQLKAQLDEASRTLKDVSMEYQALSNLKALADGGGDVPFQQADRMAELVDLMSAAESKVNLLKATIAAQNAAREPNRQTLAEVLDVDSQQVTVALAASDLRPDRQVRPGDLQLLEMTSDEARKQGYAVVLEDDPAQFVGRTLRAALQKGQVVSSDLFYPAGVRPGVAERLPPGFRAVTVTLNRESFADGYAAPETDVDVFFRAESLQDIPETTLMVLEGLTVLAVDGSVYPFPGAANDDKAEAVKVTLAVPVEAVGRVKALEGRGEITLALRSSKDRSPLTIARELASATAELKKNQLEADALGQLRKLAGPSGLNESQAKRRNALNQLIPELEDQIAMLHTEQASAKNTVPNVTLAGILGIQPPAPPLPPASIDVYMGGQRKTMVLPGQPTMTIRSADSTVSSAMMSIGPQVPGRSAGLLPDASQSVAGSTKQQNPASDKDKQIPEQTSTSSRPTPEGDMSPSSAAPQIKQDSVNIDLQDTNQDSPTVSRRDSQQHLRLVLPRPVPPVAPIAAVTPLRQRSEETMSVELTKAMLNTHRELARMVAQLESRLHEDSTGKLVEQPKAALSSVLPASTAGEQPAVPSVPVSPSEPYPLYLGGREMTDSEEEKTVAVQPEGGQQETITRVYEPVLREDKIDLYIGGIRH